MFKDNKDFYPTPKSLISKMWDKVDKRRNIKYILDPEAGKGDILEYIKENTRYSHRNLIAIENDDNLRSILQFKKDINVIDSDFLTYAGPDKFDLIMMNPPFSDGDYHLLKAIDIMYSGQIVCILNAETIKNPYSNIRKSLVAKLEALNAEIEYIDSAFTTAERTTDVSVALIYINIVKDVKEDILNDMNKASETKVDNISINYDITEKDNIHNIVKDFENKQEIGIKTLVDFYKNYKIHGYLNIQVIGNDNKYRNGTLTENLSEDINNFLTSLRKDYWRKILSFDDIYKRLTQKKIDEFNYLLENNSALDFTVSNIQTFIKNLVLSYEDTLTQATIDIFDRMTIRYAYDKDLHTKSTHYFDGWKTNEAYRVNKKVIIPFRYNFFGWNGKMELDYRLCQELDDIDKVMNYFDPSPEYISISNAVKEAFDRGENRKIESTYFNINVYKKGTIHFEFRSEDTLRKFNITACKGKGWLPHDYGNKKYNDMSSEEHLVVNTFETVKKYEDNVVLNSKNLFSTKSMLQLDIN